MKRSSTMSKSRDFKKLVRERMKQTGESYTTARAILLKKSGQAQPASEVPPRKTAVAMPAPASASGPELRSQIMPADHHAALRPLRTTKLELVDEIPKKRSRRMKQLEEVMRLLGQSVPTSEERADREAWLLSRGWHVNRPGRILPAGSGRLYQASEDWIDPTGADHSFELAVHWQLWADASKLVEDLGWGYKAGGRGPGGLRIAGPVTVPSEVTGSKTVACTLNRALRYYLDHRERADFYGAQFRQGVMRRDWLKFDQTPRPDAGSDRDVPP